MKRDTHLSDEDIEEYATNIIGEWNSTILTKLENRIVGAFLYSKINEAKSNGINVKITINTVAFKSIYETYQKS